MTKLFFKVKKEWLEAKMQKWLLLPMPGGYELIRASLDWFCCLYIKRLSCGKDLQGWIVVDVIHASFFDWFFCEVYITKSLNNLMLLQWDIWVKIIIIIIIIFIQSSYTSWETQLIHTSYQSCWYQCLNCKKKFKNLHNVKHFIKRSIIPKRIAYHQSATCVYCQKFA